MPLTNRDSVQEGDVFRPANVGRQMDGNHGQIAPFYKHKAPTLLNHRVGGGLTAITAQNMATKPTWSPAPRDTSRMLYGSATIARPIARSTRFWNIKSQRKRLRLHWRSGCSLFLLLPRMSGKTPSPFAPPGRSPQYGGNAGPRGPAMPMLYRLRKICLRTYELINFSTTMCAIKSARCNDYANISFGIYSVKTKARRAVKSRG